MNEIPLFGNICNKRRVIQHFDCDKIHVTKTGNIDEYLQKMFSKFSENFGSNGNNENLLEDSENFYCYSDSDSDSESDSCFNFEEELKVNGKIINKIVFTDLLKFLKKAGNDVLPETVNTFLGTPK